jgi:hypothetical protein
MGTVAGRADEVKRWREEFHGVSRAMLAHLECAWTFPHVCHALARVRQSAWETLRSVMDRVPVCGSSGPRPFGKPPRFGDVVRERAPRPVGQSPGQSPSRVDQLLTLVDAVEAHEGADPQWTALQEFLELETIFPEPASPPGRPEITTFWLAAVTIARAICQQHQNFYGHLDGCLPGPLLVKILRAIGWVVTYSPKDLKKAVIAWEKKHPPFNTIDVPTVKLGRLLLVDTPVARAAVERARRGHR